MYTNLVQNDGVFIPKPFRPFIQCSLQRLFTKTFRATGSGQYYSISSAANRLRAASPLRAAPASNARKHARIRAGGTEHRVGYGLPQPSVEPRQSATG